MGPRLSDEKMGAALRKTGQLDDRVDATVEFLAAQLLQPAEEARVLRAEK